MSLSVDPNNGSIPYLLRRTIYAHAAWLRSNFSNSTITVTEYEAFKYSGNFMGLMIYKGYTFQQAWIIATVNLISDPSMYDGSVTTFVVPSPQWLSQIQKQISSINTTPK